MRSASDSAFRNVFSRFQRGLPQGRPGCLRVAATLYLVFCTPLREQIHQPVASVNSGKHCIYWNNQGNKRSNASLVLVTERILWSLPITHTHRTTSCWSPRMVKCSVHIFTTNLQHSGMRFRNRSTSITSQLNRKVSNKHRTDIRKGIRNGRGQTLHFQNMCFLEFISL